MPHAYGAVLFQTFRPAEPWTVFLRVSPTAPSHSLGRSSIPEYILCLLWAWHIASVFQQPSVFLKHIYLFVVGSQMETFFKER